MTRRLPRTTKALRLAPDLAGGWFGRGNVFYNLKRYDDALAAYEKALALKPDLAEAWFGRGNVFYDLKRHDEAFAAYDKALTPRSRRSPKLVWPRKRTLQPQAPGRSFGCV